MEGGGVDSEGESVGVDTEGAGRDGRGIEAIDPFATEPITSEVHKRGWSREQAIAHGRKLAEHENEQLAKRRSDYTAENRKDRIERAERYAAWEYDGRLAGTIGKKP